MPDGTKGIGIDLVEVARLGRALDRCGGLSGRLAVRLFTSRERAEAAALPPARALEFLAGRVAAKEALAKALGAPRGLAWTDAEVRGGRGRPPTLNVAGTVRVRCAELGVSRLLLSVTHDAGLAAAIVRAE
jgi:holo-[acyl-carrier protein] synthase